MKFNINMCRGNMLDVIKLAENNNLFIESIEQGPINGDMVNIKIELCIENDVHNIDNFVKSIKKENELNSCEIF